MSRKAKDTSKPANASKAGAKLKAKISSLAAKVLKRKQPTKKGTQTSSTKSQNTSNMTDQTVETQTALATTSGTADSVVDTQLASETMASVNNTIDEQEQNTPASTTESESTMTLTSNDHATVSSQTTNSPPASDIIDEQPRRSQRKRKATEAAIALELETKPRSKRAKTSKATVAGDAVKLAIPETATEKQAEVGTVVEQGFDQVPAHSASTNSPQLANKSETKSPKRTPTKRSKKTSKARKVVREEKDDRKLTASDYDEIQASYLEHQEDEEHVIWKESSRKEEIARGKELQKQAELRHYLVIQQQNEAELASQGVVTWDQQLQWINGFEARAIAKAEQEAAEAALAVEAKVAKQNAAKAAKAATKRKREGKQQDQQDLPPPKRTRRGLRSQKDEGDDKLPEPPTYTETEPRPSSEITGLEKQDIMKDLLAIEASKQTPQKPVLSPLDPALAVESQANVQDKPTDSTKPQDASTPRAENSDAPKQNGKKVARGGTSRGRNGTGGNGPNKGKGKGRGRGRGDSPDPPRRKIMSQEEKDLAALCKARQAELKKFYYTVGTHQAEILDRLVDRDLGKLVRKANAHTKVPEYIQVRAELEVERDEVRDVIRKRYEFAQEAEKRRYEAEQVVVQESFMRGYQDTREEHLRGAQGDIVLLQNAYDADQDETHTRAGSEAEELPHYHELPEPDAHVRGYTSSRITDEKPFHQHLKYDDKVRRDVVDDDIINPRLQAIEKKHAEDQAEEDRRHKELDSLVQESVKELERLNAPRPMVNAQAPQWNLSAFADIALSFAEAERHRAENPQSSDIRSQPPSNFRQTPQKPFNYIGPPPYQPQPRSVPPPTTAFRQSPYKAPVSGHIQPVVGAQLPPLSPFPGGNTPIQTNGQVLKPMPPPAPPAGPHNQSFQQLAPAPPKVAISRAPSTSSRSSSRARNSTPSTTTNTGGRTNNTGAGQHTFIFQTPQNAPQHRSANMMLQQPPSPSPSSPAIVSPVLPPPPAIVARNNTLPGPSAAPRGNERRSSNTPVEGGVRGSYGGRQGKIAMTFVNQTVESRKAAAEGKKGGAGGGGAVQGSGVRPLLPKMG